MKITSGLSRRGTGNNPVTGGVRRAARVLVTLDSADPSKAKVFRATFACENLMCDLKLLANQPTGGDSVADTIFGLQEQSRLKIVDELRRFTEVDNHGAVKIGDLEKNSEAIKVVGPNFDREREHFPGVEVRIGTSWR